MTRRTPPPHTTPEPPPVTEQDLMAAYIVIRPLGVPYALAMTCPLHTTLRRVIECKAAQIRSDRWLQTQVRRVACVPRAVLGADGHPVGYVTQRAAGRLEPRQQNDLPFSE